MTDPIADYLTRLRNAIKAKHRACGNTGVEFEKGNDPYFTRQKGIS